MSPITFSLQGKGKGPLSYRFIVEVMHEKVKENIEENDRNVG